MLFLIATAIVAGTAQPDLVARFDAIGARALASGTTAGLSIAVVRGGDIVYARGFGLSDIAAKAPVTASTPFAIGSISKQFTAAAILLLANDGKLSIDDPLSTYVRGFPPTITLRHLLNQTSGLHNYPNTLEHNWPLSGPIGPDRILAILRTDKPDFEPGTRWEYSNANYALLTVVVEKVSGVTYGDFLRSRIFRPLGMTQSGYGYAGWTTLQPATPYAGLGTLAPQQPLISLDLFLGAGGVISNSTDLVAWDLALMRGSVVPSASVAAMWTPGHLNSGALDQYGFGFVIGAHNSHRELWHNGLAPHAGGYCLNAIFPDDGLAIVVLSNGYGFDGQADRVVREIFETYYPPTAAELAAGFTPAPDEDEAIRARVKEWVTRFASGNIDRAQLTPSMSEVLTPDIVAQSSAILAQYGEPQKFAYAGKQSIDAGTLYTYRVEYTSKVLRWIFVLAPDGKITRARFAQWEPYFFTH